MTLRAIGPILFLAISPCCIGTMALVNSYAAHDYVDYALDVLGINVWPEESKTFDATKGITEANDFDGAQVVEMLGPRWSHQGGSVRLSRQVQKGVSSGIDLVVEIVSTSGVRVAATADGQALEEIGQTSRGQRFRLPPGASQGIEIALVCDVGTWRYGLPPEHFAGFDRRAAALLGPGIALK